MDEIRKRFQQVTDMGVSIKACVAELLGTCLFVLIGLLSIVYSSTTADDTTNSYVTSFCVAFTFGIAITCMVYMTAHSSGGQLNPAITAGCMAAGATTPVQGVANIISQCIGTIISSILLIILVPASLRDGLDLGVNQVPETSNVHRAVIAEAIGMFIVVLTVLETACHNKSTSGHSTALAIGLTFVVVILAFGGVSSGSFNPARSLGPALVSGNLKNLWVFIVGPIIGGVAAAPVHLASLSGADTKRTAEAGTSSAAEPLLAEA